MGKNRKYNLFAIIKTKMILLVAGIVNTNFVLGSYLTFHLIFISVLFKIFFTFSLVFYTFMKYSTNYMSCQNTMNSGEIGGFHYA